MPEKRKVTFRIPYPRDKAGFCKRFGLNAYWSGKHWGKRKRDSEEVHETVRWCLIQQHIHHMDLGPVRITFQHNDNLDVDNHAAIEKMIVDALKGWLIPDDNKKWYREKISRFGGGDAIVVTVEEI